MNTFAREGSRRSVSDGRQSETTKDFKRTAFLLLILVTPMVALSQHRTIQIVADLTDAPRKLFHSEIDMPVTPGPLALLSPQWIPGTHGPTGPVGSIVGVIFTAGGTRLEWQRDPVNLYEYHLRIPEGVTALHAHLDCIAARSSRVHAILDWDCLMLYPSATPVREILIQPKVKVPLGWGVGTSLTPESPFDPARPTGGTAIYKETNVESLEDSPVIAGANFREYVLAPDLHPAHYVDVVGTEASDIELRPAVLTQLTQLVREAIAFYGPPHYRSYHFLLTLASRGNYGGLEHFQSSETRLPEHALTKEDYEWVVGDVLPHEFTHSWNGKYRRPESLLTTDFATPMRGDLLWVYEGLTDYLGNVLSARVGATSPERFRENLALTAAEMEAMSGREWRSMEDTAVTVPVLPGGGGGSWSNWRRGEDYYREGDLLWLNVDTTIRKLSADKKNIRDFLTIFLQRSGYGQPQVVSYDFEEIVSVLNQVVPNDWATFFRDRVYRIAPNVNEEGIEQSGYHLIFTEVASLYEKAYLQYRSSAHDVWFSLGLALNSDGTIEDVRRKGPADIARIAPGERITRVDGETFSMKNLHSAVVRSRDSSISISLLLQDELQTREVVLDYHGGERYPTLIRVEQEPDYLSEITRPIATIP